MGKIFLGKSIVWVLGKKYICVSVGGVCDDVEICGYCRIYIGVLFGWIIVVLKKVGENDFVFILDEIDKFLWGFGGDLVSVLLEVLDLE